MTGEAEPTEIRDESDTILDVRRNSERCEVHIQLVVPAQAPETRGPWAPGGLDLSEAELARLSYIVIDEIVEEIISVSVSAWPRVDDRGRLVFSDDPSVSVWADASALRRYLERTAFGDAGELRRLRMGDTLQPGSGRRSSVERSAPQRPCASERLDHPSRLRPARSGAGQGERGVHGRRLAGAHAGADEGDDRGSAAGGSGLLTELAPNVPAHS